MMIMRIRTYTELSEFDTLSDRYEYLALGGSVGIGTFNHDRWINQRFYQSMEWKRVRDEVMARDYGFDLGSSDFPIQGAHLVHHMNPLLVSDITEATDNLLNPEFLITTSLRTHNAIHYGDKSQLPRGLIIRTPGDTVPWRKV